MGGKSSKFEYTGDFRLPERGDYYYDFDTEQPLKATVGYNDSDGDTHRWRRPIMRKVEPIEIIDIHSCVVYEECVVIRTTDEKYHMNHGDTYDIEQLRELLDSGREIEYTESTGEKCD